MSVTWLFQAGVREDKGQGYGDLLTEELPGYTGCFT